MTVLVRQQHMIHQREKRFLIYQFGENKEDINEWIKRKIFRSDPLAIAYFDFDFKENLEISYKWRNWVYDLVLRNVDLRFEHCKDSNKAMQEIRAKIVAEDELLLT